MHGEWQMHGNNQISMVKLEKKEIRIKYAKQIED